MRIISWNLLRRVGASAADVAALALQQRPDLLLLQEATADIDGLPERLGGHYVRAPLPGRIHGLAAWSPSPFHAGPIALTLPAGTVVRRVAQILEFPDFAVANVHLSHGQWLNRRQLRWIARFLPPRAAILGDFNMVGDALLPGFADVGPRRATHAAARLVPLRLDRCLARGLTRREAAVLPRGGSDHHPILVVLDPPTRQAAH
jgi:endonuclease/exonuclease/phosphatase (EEP) superfamily protein YafD